MLILDELWYGNIAPGERSYRPRREYRRYSETMDRCRAVIEAELSPQGKKAFEEYQQADGFYSCQSECDSFVSGFRIGVLMMLDVFQPETSRTIEGV